MNMQISCSHVIAIILGIVFVTFFTYSNAYAARFESVPFNNIPSAIIKGIQDGHIARNSIPLLELEKNDCGYQSIEDCANFDFDIPEDILTKKYKIVVEYGF